MNYAAFDAFIIKKRGKCTTSMIIAMRRSIITCWDIQDEERTHQYSVILASWPVFIGACSCPLIIGAITYWSIEINAFGERYNVKDPRSVKLTYFRWTSETSEPRPRH